MNQNPPHIHCEEEIIAIAKQALQENNLLYDEIEGLHPSWRGLDMGVPGQEGKAIHLWSIAFSTPAGHSTKLTALWVLMTLPESHCMFC